MCCLCVGTQRALSDPDRLRYASDQFYLKTLDEMSRLFPSDATAIDNTLAIAERCALEIDTGSFHLPEFPVPEGHTLESYLERRAEAGLRRAIRGDRQPSRRTVDRSPSCTTSAWDPSSRSSVAWDSPATS